MSIAELYRNKGINPATFRVQCSRPFTVGGGSAAVTNYPVKLVIAQKSPLGSHCSSDFHDIWFTNAAGISLPFWIESIVNGTATVWLNADSIATGGTTFVLHSGDPLKGAESNGTATFSLFDDFSGDLSLWNSDSGSPSISGGLLTLSGAECSIDSKTTFGLGYAVRCLSKTVTVGAYTMPVQWRNVPETIFVRWIINDVDAYEAYNTSSNYALSAVAQNTAFHVREIRKISTSSLVFWHDAVPNTLYTYSFNASTADRAGIRANGKDVVADWILVRKIIATEPTLTNVGIESAVEM